MADTRNQSGRLIHSFLASLLATTGLFGPARGETIQLHAARDTSLFRESINSNALGGNIYTGQNMQGNDRRGLIAFDLTGQVTVGARITSVGLKLCLAGSPPVACWRA